MYEPQTDIGLQLESPEQAGPSEPADTLDLEEDFIPDLPDLGNDSYDEEMGN